MNKKINAAVFVFLSAIAGFAQSTDFAARRKSATNESGLFSQTQFSSRMANVSRPETAKDDKITPLKILSKPTAQFTEEARQNGTNGFVRLRVTFLSTGSIGDITPVDSLPDGLTESAVEAAKAIKFNPSTKNGEPITVTKIVEYSFAGA